MADQALDAAQRLGEREDLGPLDEPRRARRAIAELDADHPAEARHLAAGEVVLRDGTGGRGSRHAATSGVRARATARSAARWRRAGASAGRGSWCRADASQQSNGPGTAPAAFWMKPMRSARSSGWTSRAGRRSCRCGRSGTWSSSGARCRRRARADAGRTASRTCCPPRTAHRRVRAIAARRPGRTRRIIGIGRRLDVDHPRGGRDGIGDPLRVGRCPRT